MPPRVFVVALQGAGGSAPRLLEAVVAYKADRPVTGAAFVS